LPHLPPVPAVRCRHSLHNHSGAGFFARRRRVAGVIALIWLVIGGSIGYPAFQQSRIHANTKPW